MDLQKCIEYNIIYLVNPISAFFQVLIQEFRDILPQVNVQFKLNFDIFLFLDTITCTFSFLCGINDNSYYLQFHCHFNPFYMKRHFSTFYGHFPFPKMQGSCNPADNIIPIETQTEYVYRPKQKNKISANKIRNTNTIVIRLYRSFSSLLNILFSLSIGLK